jgi:hypothetical protein
MLAVCLVFAAVLADAPVDARAAPLGSKNFTSPPDVPNYFSSEAGSFQGNAIARPGQTGAGAIFAAPAPHRTFAAASRRTGRYHWRRAAQARRYARSRAGAHRQFVDARVAHARVAHAGVARARVAHAGVARAGVAPDRVVDARAVRSASAAGPRALSARPGPAESKAVAAKLRPAPSPAPSKVKPVARAHG